MAKDILQEIVEHKRVEVEAIRTAAPQFSKPQGTIPSLRAALLNSPTGIIAEFKRKSPSKGWIKEDGCPDIIPLSYQQNGAAALSILTDERYFGGCDDYIRTARKSGVTLPILYKNFVIDEVQLHAALSCGASAVLLIAACLTKKRCRKLIDEAHSLGLEVLLEMHSEPELEYAELNPDLCGINNRNLGSFVTDVENSFRLASQLPADSVKVSESGISDPETIDALRRAGFRGFLIGESFMKTPDPGQALAGFIKNLKS